MSKRSYNDNTFLFTMYIISLFAAFLIIFINVRYYYIQRGYNSGYSQGQNDNNILEFCKRQNVSLKYDFVIKVENKTYSKKLNEDVWKEGDVDLKKEYCTNIYIPINPIVREHCYSNRSICNYSVILDISEHSKIKLLKNLKTL